MPHPPGPQRRAILTTSIDPRAPELDDPTDHEPAVITPTGLDRRDFDPDAVRAVQRLQERGHEAYLVGGCVRDLLLGQVPKDFDIATSARPQAIKRIFPRNCRIIGRRFKLAHLHFDRNTKILEVSTFRRAPQAQGEDDEDDEDLLIRRDNEFGTSEEDALRRDFTINSLFLDPIHDEIVDHAGGLADIERRTIRTIGDPEVRFREDPVRILRAVKFAGRLRLHIEPRTAAAMETVAPDLVRAAAPRLLEEVLRLLRGGHALDAFQRLHRIDALRAILPLVDEFLQTADRPARVRFWRMLEALDGRRRRADREPGPTDWPLDNGVLLAALFLEPISRASADDAGRSTTGLAEEIVAPFATDFRLPRRDAGCLKRVCAVQHRFTPDDDGSRRGISVERFLRDPYFAEALALFELATVARGGDWELVEIWRTREREHLGIPVGGSEEPRPDSRGDSGRGNRSPKGKPRDKPKDKPRKKKRKGGGDEPPADKAAKKKGKNKKNGGKPDKQRTRKRPKPEAVETLEPEAVDVSAFDIELDPKRVATFGAIVEGQQKRRKRPVLTPEEDDYRPPPVDEPAGGAPPPPPPPPNDDDGLFGDW